MIPHVPLVKRQVDPLACALLGEHSVAHRDHIIDEPIHAQVVRQKIRGIIGYVVIILVHREVIHLVIALVQHRIFPLAEGRHHGAGAAARHQLNGRIDHPHHTGCFCGELAVIVGLLMADLPGAVHLVAKAPQPHIVRILIPVTGAHIAVIGARRQVAVFQNIFGVLCAARAEVDRHHNIAAGFL